MCLCLYLSCTCNIAARIRNKQKCSSFDTEMLLIRDGPGRSVLGLGGPGQSVAHPGWSWAVRGHPCWVRHGPGSVWDGPWRCRGGPGSSVLAPCSSVVLPCWVRVDDVFRPSVIRRGDRRIMFTPVHPGSRHLLVRGVPGLSGMVRVGSGFGVT